MKIEVGKKYIVKFRGEDVEWTPLWVDSTGMGWGPVDDNMVHRYPGMDSIKLWTPDPSEGYDIFVYGQSNFEVVQNGDQYYDGREWKNSLNVGLKPSQKFFYRRPKAKKLVPFTWEDRDFLRGKVIVSKDKTMKVELCIFWEFRGGFMANHENAETLLKDGWTFEDDTPFGKYA